LQRFKYLLKKIFWALFAIIFVIVLNFFLFRVLPGDPTRAVKNPRMTAKSREAMSIRFGLDKPIINCIESLNPFKFGDCLINPMDTQFFIYIKNLFQGELGESFYYNRPVADLLGEFLLNTVLLIGAGQILSVVIGIILGLIAAWRSHTAIDYSALLFSLFAWSLPTFWLGIMLLFAGSTWLGLPLAGKMDPVLRTAGFWQQFGDVCKHLLLPTITFTIIMLGEYMLIMRSTVLEVLSEDYILTAKAKGLKIFQILKDHALRNAMLPMITIIAMNLGFTVAGAIQIESVFSWPGLGEAIYQAVGKRDYPLLQGGFLLIAVSVILANLLADLLYTLLDPRVQEA
jgi:peptide/nickel transport system permease protein